MSYDVELFQLAEGVTLEEVNAYLQSDEYREYLGLAKDGEECNCGHQHEGEEHDEDECDCDEDEFDKPLLPEQFVNTRLAEDELRLILQKPLLQAFVPEVQRTDDLINFLNSDEDEVPEEWAEDLEMMLEYSGDPGTQPFCFGYGEELYDVMEKMAGVLAVLEPQRIALFDPQFNQVVMGPQAAQALKLSVEQANKFYDEVMESFTGVGDDDEEDAEDDK